MNYLIGSIKHCSKNRIYTWAKSASIYCSAKIILLCLDEVLPEDLQDLTDINVEVVHIPTEPQADINISKFERHFVSRKYLESLQEGDIILLTDTLDVVFQADPFKWYEQNKTNKVLLTSEGVEHRSESWNMRGIGNAFLPFADEVASRDVINSGIIMGECKYVRDLLLLIYGLTLNIKPEHTEGIDQPALNVTMLADSLREITQITTTSEAFAVNCAVAGPTPQFEPWGFSQSYKYDLPMFNGDNVTNKDNIPYCLVHQYNRVEEWNRFFVEKYKEQFTKEGARKYHIFSENSSIHWLPFDTKDKVILDFGCGRGGVTDYDEYGPIWFKKVGAKKIIGVDGSQEEINFFTESTQNDKTFTFIQKMILSKADVESILEQYPEVSAIKIDIEGAEKEFCDIDSRYLRNVSEIAIEYHSPSLKQRSLEKILEWGFNLHTIGDFDGSDEHQGVLFARKSVVNSNKTAIAVCTRGNSGFHDDWNRVFNFTPDDYMLCDVSSNQVPPINTTLKYVQDNVVMYNEGNLQNTFNFYLEPSNKHWWNNGGGRNINWFYPHFRMLYFYKVQPDYDYYWFFDDDVTFPENQLYDFVEKHKSLDHDCMITYIFGGLDQENQPLTHNMDENMVAYHSTNHNWLSHYPGDGDIQPSEVTEKYGSYFPLVRLSNKAMAILLREHQKGFYGYSEGYVPTILNHYGLKLYSIYNKQSNITLDNNLIVHHRRYHQLQWENL
jgi:hypothetical protein